MVSGMRKLANIVLYLLEIIVIDPWIITLNCPVKYCSILYCIRVIRPGGTRPTIPNESKFYQRSSAFNSN